VEVSGQLHALAALPRGKSARDLFDRSLGKTKIESGRYGEETILYLTGTPQSSSPQSVAIPTYNKEPKHSTVSTDLGEQEQLGRISLRHKPLSWSLTHIPKSLDRFAASNRYRL
jgi:hypothetical protein